MNWITIPLFVIYAIGTIVIPTMAHAYSAHTGRLDHRKWARVVNFIFTATLWPILLLVAIGATFGEALADKKLTAETPRAAVDDVGATLKDLQATCTDPTENFAIEPEGPFIAIIKYERREGIAWQRSDAVSAKTLSQALAMARQRWLK